MKKSLLKLIFLLLLLATTMSVFAQDVLPSGMQSLAESILEIFTGGFIRIILVICFCGCAVAYGFNKDNEKMKRNAIAIGVATGLIATASFIVEKIYTAAGG